ncbi:hypothetical protein ONZ51_g12345 [Trametes cubensis]|uniref:Uncharacterized protein n=1 Tax=Trametes cubensis TaxID=1111947 RepID=A0AAD7X5H8_9APHY|nr:hypothetical protein ONZ51_g12345 [Trametes cubensis]
MPPPPPRRTPPRQHEGYPESRVVEERTYPSSTREYLREVADLVNHRPRNAMSGREWNLRHFGLVRRSSSGPPTTTVSCAARPIMITSGA